MSQMEVTVVCEECSDHEREMLGSTNEFIAMKPEGELAYNREKNIQTQVYECPECGHQISVSIRIFS